MKLQKSNFAIVSKLASMAVVIILSSASARAAMTETSAPPRASGFQENFDSLTAEEVTKAIGDFGGDAAEQLAKVVKMVFAKSTQTERSLNCFNIKKMNPIQ